MIKKLENSPIIASLCANIIFLLLFIILGSCSFSSMDDLFMSSILSGAYGGEYDVHLYFVNVVYGLILKPFYYVFPQVGWYYVFEIVEVFAAFVTITYVLLSQMGLKKGVLLSAFLLCCLSPIFYFDVDFTKNAAILTAAGFLLFFIGSAKRKKILAIGIVLACAGFLMRTDAFYLGLPCLALMFVLCWICQRRFPLANLIAIACCVLINVGASQLNKSFYQDEEYKYYAAYQGPRAVFGDGRYYDYDATLDEIEERGLHGIDFKMLTEWTYYDSEVLARDSLGKFIKVINHNRHDIVLSKMPIAVVKELSRCLHEVTSWYWILLSVILVAFAKGYFCFIPWLSLGYVIMMYVYLLLVNRIASHVEASIWLYAAVLQVPFINRNVLNEIELSASMKKIFWGFACLLYVLGFWGTSDYVKANCFQPPVDNRWEAFMQYEKELPNDKILMMDLPAYKRFVFRLGGSYKTLEPGRLNRIIPLGYWNVYLPSINHLLREKGIDNPFRAIVNPNVLVVQYDHADMYADFWKLHYGEEILWKNILWSKNPGREFFSFDLTKFYRKGDDFEK